MAASDQTYCLAAHAAGFKVVRDTIVAENGITAAAQSLIAFNTENAAIRTGYAGSCNGMR